MTPSVFDETFFKSFLRCDSCLMLFDDQNFQEHHHQELVSFTVIMSPENCGIGDIKQKTGGDAMGIQDYAQKAAEKQQEERRARSEEAGYADFLKLPNGTSTLEFLDEEPRQVKGNFGDQTVFKVRYTPKGGAPKVMDYAINNKSYSLLQAIVELLAKGVTSISITRVGSGMDTRYEVAEA